MAPSTIADSQIPMRLPCAPPTHRTRSNSHPFSDTCACSSSHGPPCNVQAISVDTNILGPACESAFLHFLIFGGGSELTPYFTCASLGGFTTSNGGGVHNKDKMIQIQSGLLDYIETIRCSLLGNGSMSRAGVYLAVFCTNITRKLIYKALSAE